MIIDPMILDTVFSEDWPGVALDGSYSDLDSKSLAQFITERQPRRVDIMRLRNLMSFTLDQAAEKMGCSKLAFHGARIWRGEPVRGGVIVDTCGPFTITARFR